MEELEFSKKPLLKKPDIYLIVMDEYAGSKSLKMNTGFDNSDFEQKLKMRGFFVAGKPNSNYDGTLFSTLSLLGMGYLKNFDKDDIKNVKSYGETAKNINQNQLTRFFFQNGYKIINNTFFRIENSESKPLLLLPVEDRLATGKSLGYILSMDLFLNIPSNRIQFLLNTFYSQVDNYNQSIIKSTRQTISKSDSPIFMYTHLLIPHSPYLRDQNGKLRSLSQTHKELKEKKYGLNYINYLEYCNNTILNFVDAIQKKKSNAIVIIVSDHGNRLVGNKKGTDSDFNNFLSVYSSKGNLTGLSDTTCLVNLFRIILNNQFSQRFPLLESRQIRVYDVE